MSFEIYLSVKLNHFARIFCEIPAWGVEKKYNRDMTNIIKEIKNMCKTKEVKIIANKFPCHFSVQCTSLNRNPELVTYNF